VQFVWPRVCCCRWLWTKMKIIFSLRILRVWNDEIRRIRIVFVLLYVEVLPILSGMIQMYDRNDQRFYGFSFIELVDGLSKLMVRGRTHKFIDKNLVNLLLKILENSSQDNPLLECVSNAILNAAFDEHVQKFLETDRAIKIIEDTKAKSVSQLVQKNCDAILWTLNRIPHKNSASLNKSTKLQGHIMISYNRSVTAMCLKIRDRLKVKDRCVSWSVWAFFVW